MEIPNMEFLGFRSALMALNPTVWTPTCAGCCGFVLLPHAALFFLHIRTAVMRSLQPCYLPAISCFCQDLTLIGCSLNTHIIHRKHNLSISLTLSVSHTHKYTHTLSLSAQCTNSLKRPVSNTGKTIVSLKTSTQKALISQKRQWTAVYRPKVWDQVFC